VDLVFLRKGSVSCVPFSIVCNVGVSLIGSVGGKGRCGQKRKVLAEMEGVSRC
jgi:hypothetical protein